MGKHDKIQPPKRWWSRTLGGPPIDEDDKLNPIGKWRTLKKPKPYTKKSRSDNPNNPDEF